MRAAVSYACEERRIHSPRATYSGPALGRPLVPGTVRGGDLREAHILRGRWQHPATKAIPGNEGQYWRGWWGRERYKFTARLAFPRGRRQRVHPSAARRKHVVSHRASRESAVATSRSCEEGRGQPDYSAQLPPRIGGAYCGVRRARSEAARYGGRCPGPYDPSPATGICFSLLFFCSREDGGKRRRRVTPASPEQKNPNGATPPDQLDLAAPPCEDAPWRRGARVGVIARWMGGLAFRFQRSSSVATLSLHGWVRLPWVDRILIIRH